LGGSIDLHAPGGHRVIDLFAQHVFTKEVSGLPDIERVFGTILHQLAQLHPAGLDEGIYSFS
jgi:hypothetical protein